MRFSYRNLVVASAIALAIAAISGCTGSGLPMPANGPQGQSFSTNDALVRFVNGSPDLGAVDVYLDGRLAFAGVGFGAIAPTNPNIPGIQFPGTASYAAVPSGQALVTLYAAGTKTLVAIPFVFSTKTGDRWSVVAAGNHVTPTFQMLAFNDGHFITATGAFAFDFHEASPNQNNTTLTASCSGCSGSPGVFGVALGKTVPPQLIGSLTSLTLQSVGSAGTDTLILNRAQVLPQTFGLTYVNVAAYEIDVDTAGHAGMTFGVDLNG